LTDKLSTQELYQKLQREDVEATAEFTLRVEIAITRKSRNNTQAIEALLNVIKPDMDGFPIHGFLEQDMHAGDITLDDIVHALNLSTDEKIWELNPDFERLEG
jgi:hypothetical protein